jgi:hypothetical protein
MIAGYDPREQWDTAELAGYDLAEPSMNAAALVQNFNLTVC